ncbi:hypothetical protein [Sphingobium sp. B11D3A]|uniref:hypothetical protein n=1 Tax=Sphingobium sp. B11D3A TaxID=2940574 RepID=UPI0022242385|nr:hypothetical protein [Sphingobium sp. B11D3A]MCW2392266.1 hypothetical protein [Sphingobium sp. B11D3A]
MTQPQLYLDEVARSIILNRHRFYVKQVRKRLFSQFDDLEGQADQYKDELLGALSQSPQYQFREEPDLAEWAYDEAIGHYGQLVDLKKQVLLSSIAGMYHQWDKELREFLELELRHYTSQKWIDDEIWSIKTKVSDLFDLLIQFGWNVEGQTFFDPIEACGLIVNVYKHGKGRSLQTLQKKHGKYVPPRTWDDKLKALIDHRRMEVSDADFDEFAQAIDDFWSQFPERSHLLDQPSPEP